MAIPLIVQALLSQGLSLIGNAVLAKGQDVIEEKLGISLKPNMTPEELASLKALELKHEEFLLALAVEKQKAEIAAEQVAQESVTRRWEADMLSDSWLSKNIRPMVLLFLLSVYTIFSVASIWQWNVTQSYVELLAQMLMLVMGAYFAGRTIEKIVDMKERGKSE